MDRSSSSLTTEEIRKDFATIAKSTSLGGTVAWTEESRQAYNRIYNHFLPSLYAYCVRTVLRPGKLPKDECPRDFYRRSFNTMMLQSHRIRLPASASVVEIEKVVFAYFQKPVKWTLQELWRGRTLQSVPTIFAEELADKGRLRGEPPSPAYLKLKNKFRAVVNSLTPMDRDIIETASRYIDPQTCKVCWPADERERLRVTYEFATANALNQYRRRKFSELKRAV